MSADVRWLSEAIPEGDGLVFDLGGGKDNLRVLLEQKGWQYVNTDLHLGRIGVAACGYAHCLPFRDGVFWAEL